MEKEEKGKPVARGNKKQGAPRSRKKTASTKDAVVDEGTGRLEGDQSSNVGTGTGTIAEDGAETGRKKLYRVKFFYEWCKSCGICSAMCPVKIILVDELGHPYIDDEDACIGCRNCEIHCPDFAITVKNRYPERRKTNGTS